MHNATLRLTFALMFTLAAACDAGDDADPAVDATEDTSNSDIGDTALDDADVEPEVGADTEPDVAPDITEETTPDVVEEIEPDAPDMADTEDDLPPDGDADTGEVDAADADTDADSDADTDVFMPVTCTDDPEICEAPYVCVDELCRLSPVGTVRAEYEFDIVEPEELTRIFEFLKSLASNVKFIVIEVPESETPTPLDARYSAGDIITEDPLEVAWQEPDVIRAIRFLPVDVDEWETETFNYDLRASAEIDFPGLDPILADFGLDAVDVTLLLTLFADTSDSLMSLTGVVTRAEAESRDMLDRDALPGFADLFCSIATWDPGEMWNLSDVLDCNEAPMDIDLDGDGTMDAYRVVVDAVFAPAVLVP